MLDINTLAAWGEFIGGIAVVVSLVYLASQIRQNSKLMRVSTAAVASGAVASLTGSLAEDPELARIYREGLVDLSTLSDTDRYRFDAIAMQNFGAACTMYHLWQAGAFVPALWEFRHRGLLWSTRQQGTREWWREWRHTFDEAFRDFVDGLIREGEAAE
jgi:hypothetical protein